MKNFLLFSILTLATLTSSFAQDGDLTLQGEKWIASFKSYICTAYGPDVERTSEFSKYNVVFERVTSDSTLDNGLIKATFTENGKACRYNAIIFADNDASTYKLVTSKAYSTEDNSECRGGKALLDKAFTGGDYQYWGHPHNLTLMVPAEDASDICPGSQFLGVNFVVSGRIRN